MDALSALVCAAAQQRSAVDAAAQQIAVADVGTPDVTDVTNPVAPDPSTNVDVAEQLTTMMVAADAHHLTTAALRAALDMYRDETDLLE